MAEGKVLYDDIENEFTVDELINVLKQLSKADRKLPVGVFVQVENVVLHVYKVTKINQQLMFSVG